ncbi:hypothetical protein AKJ43_01710 [candidate division MSBL1 archaeon SCGC-AAA261D19]|uniref:Nop domain-containing protein n=1 Tax=candidate division MSBL1 archaeon SCGC-AAA261D19 TaxID=1698273 RepID=A0A133V7K5_9EURY|nr:hypothetical protein AKJ43_01710 [candidate division MSBL1 archaeon SCGC-AAA261D19]
MTIDLGECPLGVFAFSKGGEMIGYQLFPKDSKEIADRLYLIKNDKPTEEHYQLLKELYEEGHREFSMASEELASQLREDFDDVEFEIHVPSKGNLILRSSLREFSDRFDFENLNGLLRDAILLVTRKDLRREASRRDKIVIEAIEMLDELDKSINTLYSRIREWYGIHFPELERYISEYPQYFKLVSELGARENFTESVLEEKGLSTEDAKKIAKAASNSIGTDFDDMDVEALKKVVKRVEKLYEARNSVEEYNDGLMSQIAPNIRAVVGSSIGARLISLAGGLKKLARKPASTIQVLGAEKALFRALHRKGKPPKHGVIFQYPDVKGLPRKQRGKAARALANKIAVAARVDVMSGRFVGDDLKEELEDRMSTIKSQAGFEKQ